MEYSCVIKKGKWTDMGDAATTGSSQPEKSLLTVDQQVPESGTERMTLGMLSMSFCSSPFVLKLWSFLVRFLSLSDVGDH